MKKPIDVWEYAGHICKALEKGVLLTTSSGEKVNTMTIGWGHIGRVWNTPVFIAYVRETRFTKQLLEEHGEFTVNIPYGDFDQRILGFCGTKSGRALDKIEALGLHLEDAEQIHVPGIRELPLTLECRVVYQQKQDLNAIERPFIERFYPVMDETGFQDYHIVYYGEIVNAYLIED